MKRFFLLPYIVLAGISQTNLAHAQMNEADAVAPILDRVVASEDGYYLEAQMPENSALPAGGYKSILNGQPLRDVSTELDRVVRQLDTSQQQCFRLQARWTQFNPSIFKSSREICVSTVEPISPILESVKLVGGQYVLTAHLPDGAGSPEGGFKSILDGVALRDNNENVSRVLSDINTNERHCFRVQARWTQFVPTRFRSSNEICTAPVEAVNPILDSVTLENDQYHLAARMPEGAAQPKGGFKLVVDGLAWNRNSYSDVPSQSLPAFDRNQRHCFRVQARWTQFNPTLFKSSNERCIGEDLATSFSPVLDAADVSYSNGSYQVTASMPVNASERPAGGYRLIVDGVEQHSNQHSLSWELTTLDPTVQHCFQVRAFWSQMSPAREAESERQCFNATSADSARLVFFSGFENGVYLTTNKADLIGSDASGYDWQEDLESLPYVSTYLNNYVGGVDGENLHVAIVNDPIRENNRVLAMENINPVGSPRSRAQGTLGFVYDEKNPDASIYEYSVELDMLLSEDFGFLQTQEEGIPFGKDSWLSIFETWESGAGDANFDVAGRSRVSVYLQKKAGSGSPLYFRAASQKAPLGEFHNQWVRENHSVEVPIGRWFTMRAYFKAGDSDTGRFYYSIVDRGVESVVFDVLGATRYSDAPTAPAALQAKKLYVGKALMSRLQAHGRSLTIYYDNYRFFEGDLRQYRPLR